MGVHGLWEVILHAAVTGSVFEKEAHRVFDEALELVNLGSDLEEERFYGLRVGIDASAWFFHSEKADGGANPVLRNLFHRVIRLAAGGARALFVFDGPHRPRIKRGRQIYRGRHELQDDFVKIVEAFGFEWRTAPGEAEAELAHLNRCGLLDMVITDDVDCLLFGVKSMFKHAWITKQTRPGVFPLLFHCDTIEEKTGLTVPGMILVALMSGGDYEDGIKGIGAKTAAAFATAGFGEVLQDIMLHSPDAVLNIRLQGLRNTMRHELRTNESGYFDRKAAAVASKFPDDWPDVKVASNYYSPITTALQKYKHFEKTHTWSAGIDVPAVVEIMDVMFEFTHAEILQKFRSQIWQGIVMRTLTQKLKDRGKNTSRAADGSPTKALAATLEDFAIQSPAKTSGSAKASNTTLIDMINIEKKRGRLQVHITDELQLVVDPHKAAQLAESHLRHPDPNVGKLEARKEAAAAEIRLLHGPGAVGAVPAPPRNLHIEDPHSVQKLWMQESLLKMAASQLVVDWQRREHAKLEAKANKGKKVAKSATPSKEKKIIKPSANDRTPVKKTGEARAVSKATHRVPSTDDSASTDPFVEPKNAVASAAVETGNPPVTQSSARHLPKLPPKAASYRTRPMYESDSSSDSDVQIVQSSRVADLARKSPRKSPRRSMEQKTVRDAAPRAVVQAGLGREPLYPKPVNVLAINQSKPVIIPDTPDAAVRRGRTNASQARPSAYQRVIEADSSGDELPSLTDMFVPAIAAHTHSASISAIDARSSIPKALPKGRPKLPKPAQGDIIDLCSSD